MDLKDFIFNTSFHPASKMSFDELYAGLNKEVEDIYINKQVNGDLELYNYSVNCSFEKHWNEFTLIARGLILDVKNKKIVAMCLPKFFNYGEAWIKTSENEGISPELPKEGFTIGEKIDGSCCFVWMVDGEWHTSTRGSFFSEQAIWAEDFLRKNIKTEYLNPKFTYICEVIYPENRIVVKYDYAGLVLLSAYCGEEGENYGKECDRIYLDGIAQKTGLRRPKVYGYKSVDDLLKISETLKYDQEGFVVRFENGYRVKVKGREYCAVHRIISGCKPLTIWEMMSECQDLVAVKKLLPEEFWKDFDGIVSILTSKVELYLKQVKEFFEATKHLSDKEVGLMFTDNFLPVICKKFVFHCRKNKFLDEIEKPGKTRKSFFNYFRPTNNVLEGYKPTSSLTRFSQNDDL
jgi:RNA ligase